MSFCWFIILLTLNCRVSADETKRILINDPDYADTQQMHRDIQFLKDDMIQLKTKITDQDTLIQTQASMITDQQNKIQSHENTIQQILSASFGSVYIRWGRKECPSNGTDIVYSGMGGGGIYWNSGRNANPVCVPHDPDLGPVSTATAFGTVFGMEYQTNAFGSNLVNHDVPCAVCRANHASSIVMIPGKSRCYDGWKTEYSGNLMSGHHAHAGASHSICVDGNPGVLEAGAKYDNGYLLYEVKAYCGSLKCPPYVQDSTMKCVVCSK